MANVDENISRFMNAKERARKLIQMDANGTDFKQVIDFQIRR